MQSKSFKSVYAFNQAIFTSGNHILAMTLIDSFESKNSFNELYNNKKMMKNARWLEDEELAALFSLIASQTFPLWGPAAI